MKFQDDISTTPIPHTHTDNPKPICSKIGSIIKSNALDLEYPTVQSRVFSPTRSPPRRGGYDEKD